ncbi:MAG: GNAT family N-acetyltransferase [Lachnospiraceae bacterium]|nr:GNAT family N-acetyltransferase [Lachnospiraceae bacterium]
MHRLYENEDIAVFWDSEKCFHAKRCVTSSPATFDRDRRPWIDVTLAPSKEIWQAVEKCPSGALTCVYRHDVDIELDIDRGCSIALHSGKKIGECDFEKSENGWNIYHTEVLPEYGGRGIAKRLVYKTVEAAERNKAAVIPTCSYAAALLDTKKP